MNIKIGILIYNKVQPMDVIGPWEVLAIWQKALCHHLKLYLISEAEGYVECDSNIVLKSHLNFSSCEPLDYLIVPGGVGRLEQVNNSALINFIKEQSKSCKLVMSVCTGAFLLAKAGLLTKHAATTYWRAINELTALPEQITITEERIVKSGKIWTAGGVTSGIDLGLALIHELSGEVAADKVRLLLEYFPPSHSKCDLTLAGKLPAYNDNYSQETDLPAYIIAQCLAANTHHHL